MPEIIRNASWRMTMSVCKLPVQDTTASILLRLLKCHKCHKIHKTKTGCTSCFPRDWKRWNFWDSPGSAPLEIMYLLAAKSGTCEMLDGSCGWTFQMYRKLKLLCIGLLPADLETTRNICENIQGWHMWVSWPMGVTWNRCYRLLQSEPAVVVRFVWFHPLSLHCVTHCPQSSRGLFTSTARSPYSLSQP